jgi:DNA (cytosine-5)-methyltransferase 3A
MALERAGVPIATYFASEIDAPALRGAQRLYPDTVQLGSVFDVKAAALPRIDLLLGGSPCQTFSRGGNNTGFAGKSGLILEFFRVLGEARAINPNLKFLLENVEMRQEWEREISAALGVEPLRIDSTLVSAQKRQRLYWTNIAVAAPPQDRGVELRDVLEPAARYVTLPADLLWHDAASGEWHVRNGTKLGYLVVDDYDSINLDFPNSANRRGRVGKRKINTLTTSCAYGVFVAGRVRRLSAREAARCQTLDDAQYDRLAEAMSEPQLKRALGNGWTVDVIAHILGCLL